MTFEIILVEDMDGVRQITLNRPDRLNAWTYQMFDELVQAIREANDNDDLVAMVVTGAGKGFCAGADIEAVFQAQIDGNEVFENRDGPADWVALIRGSKPIVAAINGVCIGLGITQILPMDYLIASEQATFSLRFVKLGIVPELASSNLACLRMGFGKASELFLTGRIIDAQTAAEYGLVDKLVGADVLLQEAHKLAREMGDNPQSSLKMIKQLLTENACETDLNQVQTREFSALEQCYASEEHKEAIAAFMNKRKPDFKAARLRERQRGFIPER